MRKRTVSSIVFQIALLTVLLFTIIGIPPNNASAAAFSIGDTVEVYNTGASGLLVRDAPCGNNIGGKFDGSQGTILAGPVFCSSYNRWQIRWSDGLQGWSAENWLKKVSATPDSIPPTVNSLNVNPSSVNVGSSFTISCSVSDSGGSGLNRIELWRANDSGGSPVSWGEIQRNSASGSSSSTSFSDTPSAGTYWYGIHVVDNAGNWGAESSPVKRTVVAADTTAPNVTSFAASASEINQGQSVTLSYTVSDNAGLKQVELWRADDSASVDFREVNRTYTSNKSYSGSFSDTPPSPGTYRYGLHVVDTAGKWNCERNSQTNFSPGVYGPIQVVMKEAALINESPADQRYELSVGLKAVTFEAISFVEVQGISVAINSDQYEKGSYGPCQVRKTAIEDANLPFRQIQPKFTFETVIGDEGEYKRFVLTYAGIILRDYLKIDPRNATLDDLEHIVLAWVNPTYYMQYYRGEKPPLADYQNRLSRLNVFLANNKLQPVSQNQPATSCPTGQFQAMYYNNRFLEGEPDFAICESSINHNWDWGGPRNNIDNDNFSVRWSGRFNFFDGNYTFKVRADDGIRVWLNNDLIIDEWKDQPTTEYKQERFVSAGEHEVKVEYYENSGRSVAEVSWGRVLKQPDETYYWTKPPVTDRGGLVIPKELFPEGNEVVIPVHVPNVIDDSNLIREDDGWGTLKEIRRTKLDFDWAKFISGFSLASASTPEGTVFSVIAGFMKSVSSATSICDMTVKIEKDFESNFRAIVEVHDPNRSYFARQYAGQNVTIPNRGDNIIRGAFSKWLASAFGLEPDRFPQMYYMMSLGIDRAHRDDECVAYLSMSEQGQVIITPKVYQNDRLRIVRIYEILFIPYRLEVIVDVTGDALLNLWEQPLPGQSSGSMLEVLAPIRFTSK